MNFTFGFVTRRNEIRHDLNDVFFKLIDEIHITHCQKVTRWAACANSRYDKYNEIITNLQVTQFVD